MRYSPEAPAELAISSGAIHEWSISLIPQVFKKECIPQLTGGSDYSTSVCNHAECIYMSAYRAQYLQTPQPDVVIRDL